MPLMHTALASAEASRSPAPTIQRAKERGKMGWPDANEYLLMEMTGRDRADDITQMTHLVCTAGDRHDGSDVTPYEIRKRAPRFAGRLMCFLLGPG